MGQSLCKLTLVYPIEKTDILAEFILNNAPIEAGFTSWEVDGHGHDFEKANISERVRGRVKRGTLVTIMAEKQVRILLEKIRKNPPIPEITYWTEPINAFGQLG